MEPVVAFTLGAGLAAIGWALVTYPFIQFAAQVEEICDPSEEERAEEERWRKLCEKEQ